MIQLTPKISWSSWMSRNTSPDVGRSFKENRWVVNIGKPLQEINMPKRGIRTGTFCMCVQNPIVLNLFSTKSMLLQVLYCKDTYNIWLLKNIKKSFCGFVQENINTKYCSQKIRLGRDSLLPLDQGCNWEPDTHLVLSFRITVKHILDKRIVFIRSLLKLKVNCNLVYKISDCKLQFCYSRLKCFHIFLLGKRNTFLNFVAVK